MSHNYVAFCAGDTACFHFFDDSLAVERDVALNAAKRGRGSVWRRPSWDPQWRGVPQLCGGPIEAPRDELPPMVVDDEPEQPTGDATEPRAEPPRFALHLPWSRAGWEGLAP